MKINRRFFVVLALLLIAGAAVFVSKQHFQHVSGDQSHSGKEVYYCPMHPAVTSSKPGNCPICSMRLVKREDDPVPAAGKKNGSPAAGKKMEEVCLLHNCSMGHDGAPCPMMVIAKPGEEVTCPICGTHITVVEDSAAAAPGGYAVILLSPQKQQLIGVKTSPAVKKRVAKTIRTSGKVMTDETRVVHVHPKVEGWVEQIFARYEGDPVKKGQPLFSFYSPDFVSAQQEYLSALKMVKELPAGAGEEIMAAAQAGLEAGRQRLRWWDVSDEQVKSLEEKGAPSKTLLMSSPIGGIVLKKHVFAGEYMERGADFYHLADLSTVWVDADLYEYDLPLVAVGQEAVITLPNDPSFRRQGKVVYLSPFLKPETRTATARVELANLEGFLRPDMFTTVEIRVDLGEQLAVPEESVFDTGTRRILFVDKGEGIFEPREVLTGAKADGYVVVNSGVKEGEPVVTSGNFLIDSESRLKSALTSMEGGGHSHGQ